jgi:hypothetical protein
VTFKWQPPVGYRSHFDAENVLTMRNMIRRHYAGPHRFVCVTDDSTGLDEIETIDMWDDLSHVPSPHGAHNPSCYRRLKLFAPDAGELFGAKLVAIDLDMVITGSLNELFDRPDDFVIWGQSDYPKTNWYNGSLWMLRTGTRPQVWTQFDAKASPTLAWKAGKKGSDQGWIGYVLGPKEATWNVADGVYSYRVHLSKTGWQLPDNAKVVAFHGKVDPWSYQAQQHGWVRECYQ